MYNVEEIDPNALFPKGVSPHGRSTRAPATGTKGMVASAHPYASRAGLDVLRDAPSFTADHVGFADRIEQFGLTVVDVTHHGHHGRSRLEIASLALVLSEVEVEGL